MPNRRGTPRRRSPRALLAGPAVALAVLGLAGCRTDPNVAAYVGNGTIPVDALQAAVAEHKQADPAIAAYAQQHPVELTREVLDRLVLQRVYAAAAQRYGVQVGDRAVQQELTQLLAGQDPTTVLQQLAARGIDRQDLDENVRQLLVRQAIARNQGLAGPLSESALRARYQQVRGSLGQKSFGYITVPDQAAADAVLKQLTADPASYPQAAAAHPGQNTLPTMQPQALDQFPQSIAQGVTAAKPNTGFTVSIPQVGVVVVFVGDTVYPSFDDVRGQLQQEAETTVDQAAQKFVDQVRGSLNVKVNPRYGVLQKGQIQPATGGVVDLLGSGDATASAAGGSGSGGSGSGGSGAAGG